MAQKTQTGAFINLEGWDGEGAGREVLKGGDICIPMADSCRGLTENTKFCKAIILQQKDKAFKIEWNFPNQRHIAMHQQLIKDSKLAAAIINIIAFLVYITVFRFILGVSQIIKR